MSADANDGYCENIPTTATSEADILQVTLTQSATEILIPAGEPVIRVQVTPGETLQLPFPQGAMAARLDDGTGNLAVKVGDVTVVLQGYAAATGEAPVTLIDSAGTTVDVASVIDATDPNLDIQTAAGAAAGDQGTGVDNNGGVFTPFDPSAGIGGLNAVGGLGQTELQYGLIHRQNVDFEENDEVAAATSVRPRFVVNEDDLERSEEFAGKAFEPYPSHVLNGLADVLGAGSSAGWDRPFEQGNDPFDTDDNEEASQNNPPLSDAGPNGVDHDREPLTVTAVTDVNFAAGISGHLSFTNGSTPIIDQLSGLHLTSHSLELKYAVLPGAADSDPNDGTDDSHGETLVAYVEESYDIQGTTYTTAYIVFTIGFREFEGVDPQSAFNTDFTLYGVIDNVPGTPDAVGDIAEALDIDVPFFLVDSNGAATPAPNSPLPFTVVDDVPSLGQLDYEWAGEGEGDSSWEMIKSPSDTGIVHDETDGQQSPEDVDPQQYQYQINQALEAADWPNVHPLGSAVTYVSVSFGADGRAGIWDGQSYVGNKEAGSTVFTEDGDAYSNAFQLYMGDTAAPLVKGLTNWTITVDGVELAVYAEQMSTTVIKGYALDGEVMHPVFVLSIDPSIGEVILTQIHAVNHGDTTDGDEATPPLQIYGPGETPVTLVFQDDFNDLSGWTTIAGGNAQIVTDPNTFDPQPNPSGAALLVSHDASVGDIEAFFGLTAGELAAAANDGDDNNGDELPINGSAIKQTVDISAGDEMTVRFNFLESETDGGEQGDGSEYEDFAFIVINGEVIRLANVGEPGVTHQSIVGGFSWSEESGYLVFHFDFTVTGPVEIGFGVMNEEDNQVNAGLLIDQIVITQGNDGSNVIVRATDYDGDYVETPLDVTIRDDKPTLSVDHYDNDYTAEDEGSANNGDIGYLDEDWLGGGNTDNDGTATDDIGGTQSIATLNFDPGADGTSSAFPLSLDPATIVISGSIDTVLQRASDGAVVKLVGSGDGQVVTGYADADNDGTISQAEMIDDNKMFSVSIIGNQIAFNLYQPLRHDAAGSGVGDGNIESDILFEIPVKTTDGDGDTASVSVKFVVDDDVIVAHDDGPLAISGLGNSKAIGGNLLDNDDVGADRAARVTSVTIDGTEHPQTGNGFTYYLDATGHITTPDLAIGALGISPSGQWHFTQLKNIESEDAPTLTFGYTAADADGDTSSAEFSVTLKHFKPASFEDETALVDEDGLPGGAYDDPEGPTNDGAPGDDVAGHQVNGEPNPATEAIFRNTLGNGFNWNGDVGTLTFTFDATQIASIVLLDGTVLTLANVEGNGTDHVTVWAGTPGESAKVLEFTVIDNATAVYEVELFSPIRHPGHDNPQTQNAETLFEDNVLLPVTVTATNGGGAPSHTLTISIDDDVVKQWGWGHDGPGLIYNSDLYQWLDEDFVGNGNQDKDAQGNSNWDTNGDDPFFNVSPGSVIATNVGKGHIAAIFGADGPGELPYGLAIVAPGTAIGTDYWGAGSPLETTAGSALKVLSSSVTELVIADSSNNPVLTLTIDRVTGDYTFTQIQPLDHHGIDTEDNIYLRFDVTYTDGDGDVLTGDIGFVIDDDAPETQNSTSGVSFWVDEATPATDDTEGYSWMFHPVKYGADGPGTIGYSLTGANGQPIADTTTIYKDVGSGEFIKLHQVDANTVEGRTENGGLLVFVVTLGAQSVEFDLQRPIDHAGEEFDYKYLSLPIHVTQTVTDGDGDSAQATATANMSVRVEDAAPDAVDDGTYVITQTGKFVTNAFTANDDFGTDGPGQVTKVTYNGTDYLMSGASLSIDVTGGKLTVNSNGSWFFEQPNNLPVPTTHQFSYTIRDADGSTDSATFAVALRTDMPVSAADDWLITSETQPFNIPTDWLVRNDIDDHKYLLDIVNAQSPGNILAVSGWFDHVDFDLNPQGLNPGPSQFPFPDALFTYTVSDEAGHSDQGGTLVDYVATFNVGFANNQVTGTNNADIIIGNEFGETLSGSGGDDILYGGRDAGFPVMDMLDGGSGNDWLIFGPSDILQGGLDFDTVRFDKFPLANVDLDHSGQDFVGRIHDVEAIDLRTSGAIANFGNHADADNGLSAQDVIDMTDANDTLYILGYGDGAAGPGVDEKVYLDGAWNQNGQINIVDPTGATGDFLTFVKYTSGLATVYIQNTIDVE